MAITLHQINGGVVPPVADARLYDFLGGAAVGIASGCEVTSIGGNQLQISGGWGIVYGRTFTVTQTTISAAVSQSGDAFGRLLIRIDTTSETPISFVTQAEASLPELTQQDINAEGTIYELPLATYTVNEIAISDLVSVAPVASSGVLDTYNHTKSGSVHTLTGSGSNIKFISNGAFEDGDTFLVNGEACTAITTNGEALPGGYFTSGVVVSCFKNGNELNFKSGGASGGMNFKIVGGIAQPTKPAENTIWIKTSTNITDYQFTNTAPTKRSNGAAMTGGEIYITVGTASNGELNISKNGVMMVYPTRVYQLVDGIWNLLSAQTYKNGTWNAWRLFYWYENTAYLPITNTGTNVTNMNIPSASGDATRSSLFYGDLTNVSTLRYVGTWDSPSTYANIFVGAWSVVPTSSNTLTGANRLAFINLRNSSGTEEERTVDVSSVVGNVYFGIAGRNGSSGSWSMSASELTGEF